MSLGWVAIAAAVQAAATGNDAAAPLQPQGKWTVDYADSMCVLSRRFGPPESGVLLALRPLPLGDSTEFVLIVPDTRKEVQTGRAMVGIQPSVPPKAGDYVSWPMAGGKHRITTVTIADTQPALAAATAISITVDRKAPIVVAPAGIARAMAAVASCQDDLLRSWQIDPKVKQLIDTPAKGIGEQEWIKVDDYPAEAIRNGDYGTTTILWTIGIDGKVGGCHAVGRSGSDILDGAACAAITKRGRYTPARDRAGKAIASYAMRRVVWRIPTS